MYKEGEKIRDVEAMTWPLRIPYLPRNDLGRDTP